MNEEELKQMWDNLFKKLNEEEITFLAVANNEKNKEIERLNNIINELEKFIKEESFIMKTEYGYIVSNDKVIYEEDLLNKLKELKEVTDIYVGEIGEKNE